MSDDENSSQNANGGQDEAMDHRYQLNLEKLKKLEKNMDWTNRTKRHYFLVNLGELFYEWEGQLPDLREIFQPAAMENLLSEAVENTRAHQGETVIGFVVRTGYKDTLVDDDGKPVLRRTTPLHRAAKCRPANGWEHVVHGLFTIYDRFDVNYTDDTGITHFHVACKFGCDRAVKSFLELGQDPNIAALRMVEPPLHMAASTNRRRVTRMLLKHGANPDILNKNRFTTLQVVCKTVPDCYDVVKMLFELSHEKYWPLDVNAKNRLLDTPLHWVLPRDCKNVVRFLLENGANPNSANADQATPLHIICSRQDDAVDLAEMLFELGGAPYQPIQINAQDSLGRTPLLVAATNTNKRQLIEFLLRRGSDPNVSDAQGFTPLHVMCKKAVDYELMVTYFNVNSEMNQSVQINALSKTNNTPLHLALNCWNNEKAHEFLLRQGADPNITNMDGSTALHLLCDKEKKYMEQFFQTCEDIGVEVELDARDRYDQTALHKAVGYNSFDIVVSLLRRGANQNLTNDEGLTVLLRICHKKCDVRLAKVLFSINDEIQHKMQIDQPDSFGQTPLQLAVLNFLPHVVDLLLDNGADLSDFVFPIHNYYSLWMSNEIEARTSFSQLGVVSGTLAVLDSLYTKGYDLDQDQKLGFMLLFPRMGLFENWEEYGSEWKEMYVFASVAKQTKINATLSLYDLVKLTPDATTKLLSCMDYYEMDDLADRLMVTSELARVCTVNLCERVSRRFFRRWSCDFLWELVDFKIPSLCCHQITGYFTNQELLNICKAAEGL